MRFLIVRQEKALFTLNVKYNVASDRQLTTIAHQSIVFRSGGLHISGVPFNHGGHVQIPRRVKKFVEPTQVLLRDWDLQPVEGEEGCEARFKHSAWKRIEVNKKDGRFALQEQYNVRDKTCQETLSSHTNSIGASRVL